MKSKVDEINKILNSRKFDIISLNETKLDENTPDIFKSNFYNFIRRDRTSHGGGLLIFIRLEYKIVCQEIYNDYEIIFFQLLINGSLNNFISCYNPHTKFTKDLLNYLENVILLKIDLKLNLFIVGDFNNDFLSLELNLMQYFLI